MRMFEYFEDSNRFYIISDLYQGGELYDFIKDNIDPKDPVQKSKITEDQARKIVK